MRLRIVRVAGVLAVASVASLSAADGTLRVIDAVKQGNRAAVRSSWRSAPTSTPPRPTA